MISQEVKELLKVISHDELIEFVRENSERDEKFRSHFLAFFGHLSQDQTKAFYQKQIHAILKTAAGRDGWIGWSDMKYVVTAIEPFLENADKHFASNNFENVLFIGTALLEEITEALEYADDSNGDLGYFIDSALIFLSKLTRQFLSTKLEDEMFEYCISVFKQNIFKGREWHMSMLRLASELINTESKAIVVLDCLDSINSRYEQEYAENLKLELLKKFRDPKGG